jgi:antitoxin (DNA-binding transcriptional repressor) of toxin-antitoxin stability system
MTKQVTVEELEEHLRERLEDVRNGQSVRIVDGTNAIGTIEPTPKRIVNVIRHDPAFRLQDFKPGAPLLGTGSVEWLLGERDRERSDKKRRS